MKDLQTIRNIGPAMAAHLQNAGFFDAQSVYDAGNIVAYSRLIDAGMRPHFMAFMALSAGLENRDWNDHSAKEKRELRKLHDEILNKKRPKTEFEAFLNEMGFEG